MKCDITHAWTQIHNPTTNTTEKTKFITRVDVAVSGEDVISAYNEVIASNGEQSADMSDLFAIFNSMNHSIGGRDEPIDFLGCIDMMMAQDEADSPAFTFDEFRHSTLVFTVYANQIYPYGYENEKGENEYWRMTLVHPDATRKVIAIGVEMEGPDGNHVIGCLDAVGYPEVADWLPTLAAPAEPYLEGEWDDHE